MTKEELIVAYSYLEGECEKRRDIIREHQFKSIMMMTIAEPSELQKVMDAMKEDLALTAQKHEIGRQLAKDYGLIVLP